MGFRFPRLFVGHLDRLRDIRFLDTQVPEIEPDHKALKPGGKGLFPLSLRHGEFLLEPTIIMDASGNGIAEKQNPFAGGGDKGIFDRMALLFATEFLALLLVILRTGMRTFRRIDKQLGELRKGFLKLLDTRKFPGREHTTF